MTSSDEDVFSSKIAPGQVFYILDKAISPDIPHYYIVLNINPALEKELILVCATTLDIWGAQTASKYPESTFVALTPSDCSFLKVPSLFDCNRPLVRHIKNLAGKLSSNQLKLIGSVSEAIVIKLREGVRNSRLVPGKIKRSLEV